jgi:hypothetical protein
MISGVIAFPCSLPKGNIWCVYLSLCVCLIPDYCCEVVSSPGKMPPHFSQLLCGSKSCDISFLLGYTLLQQLIFHFVRLLYKSDNEKNIAHIQFMSTSLHLSCEVSHESVSYLQSQVLCSAQSTCQCHTVVLLGCVLFEVTCPLRSTVIAPTVRYLEIDHIFE